jgi:hypothetical protein
MPTATHDTAMKAMYPTSISIVTRCHRCRPLNHSRNLAHLSCHLFQSTIRPSDVVGQHPNFAPPPRPCASRRFGAARAAHIRLGGMMLPGVARPGWAVDHQSS